MTDLLRSLLETRSAVLMDVAPDDRLLIASDATGTRQLYELRLPDEDLHPVTMLPEPVGAAAYVPGRRELILEMDRGGDELHQLYRLRLDRTGGPAGLEGLEALTSDPRFGHHLSGVRPDGRAVAYVSNRANGVDFDVWLLDLATGEHRLLCSTGSYCRPGPGWSPDGRRLAVLRPGRRPLDTDLLVVDARTGEGRPLLPHPDEAALVDSGVWVGPTTLAVASNVGRDTLAVVRVDLLTGEVTPVAGDDGAWDLEPADATADGRRLLVVENRNGSHALVLLGPGDAHVEVSLPEPGVVSTYFFPGPRFSSDGRRVYFTLSTPRRAGDVWSFDPGTGEVRALTRSHASVPPDELVSPEDGETRSFDGEHVPLLLYRPTETGGTPPVVVLVHGGPEGQTQRSFNPIIQYLALAGYAVVAPNVRGSVGYGKRYASLDDTTKRLDSVRDLAAVHDWLGAAGLDATRAALWGGSYGGYMVLAGLAFQPDRWAAGVDIVGISDLITFLEHTSEYRRAHRELEYGSLATDRDFLAAASPLRHADAMQAPLFMIHGRNDPRVPVTEAEQLAAELGRRGVPCELLVYEDEGHGLARLANRLDAYPKAVAFLDRTLRSD